MKHLILIFLALSCGYDPLKKPKKKRVIIETPELDFYVDRFERFSDKNISIEATGLIIEFADLEGLTAGICTLQGDKEPHVKIDRDYWATASDAAKENLVFHELGHCILHRGHLDDYVDKKPVSLMNAYLIPYYYEKDKKYYRSELYSITGDWLTLTGDYHWTCGGNHGKTK